MYGGSKALDSPHQSACPPALRRVRRAVLHRTGKLSAYGEDSHLRLPGALDLVDDQAVDLAGLNIAQQLGEGRPGHGAAAVAAVVIAFRQHGPTGMLLAVDVSQASFALGIEAGEGLVQAFLGGFA